MYITSREKEIIELIVKTSGKHTAAAIAKHLNVSVRTIHRDLNAVDKTLEAFGLRLTRHPDKGIAVDGKNEQLFRLIQYLAGTKPIDQTSQEKKLLLLLSLFEEESYKIKMLANDLSISVSTLTAYLDQVTEWVKDFNIDITRTKGIGVEVLGKESDKRNALAGYVLQNFNEELIEYLFMLEKGEYSSKTVLYYFKADYLLAIEQIMHRLQPHLADSDYLGFIVHLCTTIQRTEDQFILEEEYTYNNEFLNEYHLIIKIYQQLEMEFPVTVTNEDLVYLSIILRGSKLKAADAAAYDSIMLSRMIKNLIQNVSSQLHTDLTNDFSLYQGLLAHMEPALFRLKQHMGMYNPLTEEIRRKYPVLFMAVKNGMENELKDTEYFPDGEVAFIVLHFGSALVLHEEKITIKALIVCPTGIGTSKMLASRIKKEIPEIDSIKISSINEIQRNKNLKNSDLIISTVRLPLLDMEYLLVSPLLTEENVQSIREFLKNNIEKLTQKHHYLNSKPTESPSSGKINGGLRAILQDLEDIKQGMDSILNSFHVYEAPNVNSHEQIISEMVRTAESEQLLTDANAVIEALKERERKGGLGIPDTEMALFHCRDRNVHQLIFRISYSEAPLEIKGMDNKKMTINHLLLMLAPDALSVKEQEIISLVSTGLIESKEAMMIFSSANEELIKKRLEAIFLEYLHNHVVKE